MDVKDLRTESGLSERNNDGSKYNQGVVAPQCNRNKSYQDIGSIPLAKAEPTPVRPCAVIGPDRVVLPPASNDAFLKKGPVEPWPSPDNLYRRPPEYSHKLSSDLNPSRNISPRQTFQENMQRILVPPIYNAVIHSDEANFNHIHDRNSKNVKPNMASEAKYCDVPYSINTLSNEPKNVRDAEMYVPSMNSPLTRTAPHGWSPSSVNVHAPRTFGAHELYQYQQFPSCAGQRPAVIPMTRPHRTIQEDSAYVYSDHYYQDVSARYKPYPLMKDRYPQTRYEYIANHSNHQFHPPAPLQPHKYDMSKSRSGQAHQYSVYPHLKYLDNRVPDHSIEGYQRPTNQSPHYNIQYRNQVIHPTYAPVPGNHSQNKLHPYLPDGLVKSVTSNKLTNDNNSKMYIDYENVRSKTYPTAENYFLNEMGRVHPLKNQMVMPNYPPVGVQPIPTQQYYRKDNPYVKPLEYMPHFRNFEHPLNSNVIRHAPQFSPNALAISPTESNTSNDTSRMHGTSQEDCGYVSQSSTASVRSVDSGTYRMPNDYYKRYDFRYGPLVGSSPTVTRVDSNSGSVNSKETKEKQIDVRQFLQMWNEGEEENGDNNITKEIVIQTSSDDTINYSKHHVSNQDQLYVLGLVNVPREELSKYEHIQKISKLPENIKGYNNLELLSQFEEAIGSSNTSSFKSHLKEYPMPSKDNSPKQAVEALPRPVSPLDVEAKISQSVIHKEVGCNFEIRPCSPKMLNVEAAAPVYNILGERVIEKVTNPLSKTVKSPMSMKPVENSNFYINQKQENTFAIKDNPSCKMVRSPHASNNIETVKTNYSLQDLEINSGVCLASLPRLDNEIELNFPEVNQQFINANKKDAKCHQNNSPQIILEEQRFSDNKLDKTDMDKSEKALIAEESGKPFTKLSQYRKLKTAAADHLENNQLTKAVRTDSVIIKNPENIKNIEDKLLENSNNVPINLSSQSSVCHTTGNLDLTSKLNVYKDNEVAFALDFSLNKSGNDLPIVEIENNEHEKQTKMPVENVSHTYDKTTIPNKSLEFTSKDTILEYTEQEPNYTTCIDSNSNDSSDVDKTKPGVDSTYAVKDDTSAVSENTEPVNEHLNVTYDAKHLSTSYKQISETQDDDYVTSKDNSLNEQDLPKKYVNDTDLIPPTGQVPNYEEGREMMELLISENNGCNLMNDNEDNIKIYNTELISAQNKKDLENDEISAKLEKLFQESNEEMAMENEIKEFSKSLESNLNLSVTMPVEAACYRKSKELYSPRIQKLLMHTEGLCAYSTNGGIQEKSINANIEHRVHLENSKSSNTELKKDEITKTDEIPQKPNGDQNNRQNISLHQNSDNNISLGETTKDPTADIKFETDLKSIINKSQPNSVHNSFSEIKELSIIKKNIPEKTDKSNTEKLSSGTREINLYVKSNKDDVSEWESHKSESAQIHLNNSCDSLELSQAMGFQNNSVLVCESNLKEESNETLINKKNVYVKKQEIYSTETVYNTNYLSSEKHNSDKAGFKLDKVVLGSINPCVVKMSKTVFINTTGSQAYENSEASLKKECINPDGSSKNQEDNLRKCNVDSVSNEYCKDGHKTEDDNHVECLNENLLHSCESKKEEAPGPEKVNNASERSLSVASDICTTHKKFENQHRERLPQNAAPEHDSNKISSYNILGAPFQIASEFLNNPNTHTSSNSDLNNCTGRSIGDTSIDLMKENLDVDPGKAPITSGHGNIPRDFYDEFKKDIDNNSKIISLPYNIADHCTKHQREENLGEVNLFLTSDSDRGETFDNIGKECNANFKNKLNNPSIKSDSDRDEALEGLDCGHSSKHHVQSVLGNPGIERLSVTDTKNCTGNVIVENQTDETSTILSNSNEGESLHKYDSGIAISEMQEDSKNSAIQEMSNDGNCADNTEKNLCEGSFILNNDRENPDRITEALVCGSIECDNKYQKIIKHPETLFNTVDCSTHQKEENKSGGNMIKYVNENCNDNTGETSNKNECENIACVFDSEVIEDVNNPLENFSTNVTDYCSANGSEEKESLRSSIDNVIKTRDDSTKIIEPLVSDKTVCTENGYHNDSNNPSYDNQSTAHETNGYQSSRIKIENVNKNPNTDIDETFNIARKFDNMCHSSLNISSPKNMFEIPSDANDCTQHQTHNNDKSANHKSMVIETPTCTLEELPKICNTKNYSNDTDSSTSKYEHGVNADNVYSCESERRTNHQNKNISLNITYNIVDDEDQTLPERCNKENKKKYNVVENETQSKNKESKLSTNEFINKSPVKRKYPLKRSFSDSALHNNTNKDAADTQVMENFSLIWPSKRQKMYDIENSEQHIIDDNLCSMIQNRRNSVASFYNEGNVSFCILIDDDCILTEENEEEKICYAELSEDCITEISTTNEEEDNVGEIICSSQHDELNISHSVVLDYENEKSIQESWLNDVACVETVVSDDIEEDILISTHDSSIDLEVSVAECDESRTFNCEHTDGINFIDAETILNVSQVEETYFTPHIPFDKLSYVCGPELEVSNGSNGAECLETILSESNSMENLQTSNQVSLIQLPDDTDSKLPEDKENICSEKITLQEYNKRNNLRNDANITCANITLTEISSQSVLENTTRSSEMSIDSKCINKDPDEDFNSATSSSPEVSSTTSEEKNSSILLKITNYNGSRVSEINEVNHNRPRCKFTEKKDYSNSHGSFPKRPLLTKAAQKYIPPIKESIRDLKVKLTLPQQRLHKLKQLKLSRSESKTNKQNNTILTVSKKPKPNFEDVLKSIDEVQIKMHKEKSKKPKNIIPKVVIKKNFNGSHYTSSTNKDTFNPDLTGRKWQPWVFLEKNHFIDKMAIRNKTKAIYNYRKNAYVLAEKFKKYKSVCNSSAKFVISQPKTGDTSKGQLKYTIRLKHTY